MNIEIELVPVVSVDEICEEYAEVFGEPIEAIDIFPDDGYWNDSYQRFYIGNHHDSDIENNVSKLLESCGIDNYVLIKF